MIRYRILLWDFVNTVTKRRIQRCLLILYCTVKQRFIFNYYFPCDRIPFRNVKRCRQFGKPWNCKCSGTGKVCRLVGRNLAGWGCYSGRDTITVFFRHMVWMYAGTGLSRGSLVDPQFLQLYDDTVITYYEITIIHVSYTYLFLPSEAHCPIYSFSHCYDLTKQLSAVTVITSCA
jgi:hypothetical protein